MTDVHEPEPDALEEGLAQQHTISFNQSTRSDRRSEGQSNLSSPSNGGLRNRGLSLFGLGGGSRDRARAYERRRSASLDSDMSTDRVSSTTSGCSEYDAEELHAAKQRRVQEITEDAETRSKQDIRFFNHLLLAVSVGFWVMLFAMPSYVVGMHYYFFGQRGAVVLEELNALNASKNETAASDNSMVRKTVNTTARLAQLTMSCAVTDFGRLRNIAPAGSPPDLVPWTADMEPWDLDNNANDIWCGLVPSTYSDNWANAAQFVVFTVAVKRGTTINQAFQGITGTLMAVLNIHLMSYIFPFGARGHLCTRKSSDTDDKDYVVMSHRRWEGWRAHVATTLPQAIQYYNDLSDGGGITGRVIYDPSGNPMEQYEWYQVGWEEKFSKRFESISEEECEPGSTVYLDPNYAEYGEVICMFDVILVLLLFLIGNISKTTIMWGMSSHVYLMMNFMNPAKGIAADPNNARDEFQTDWWLTEYFVTQAMVLVGAVVSIISTMVPYARLGNVTKLFDDAMMLTQSITTIWQESVTYLSGSERTPVRFQIETRIDALEGLGSTIQENVDGAWWEALFVPRRSSARRRSLFAIYDTNALDIKDMVYILKTCVLSEDFSGEHDNFWQGVKKPVTGLVGATTDLMWLCLRCAQDGYVDSWELEQIKAQVAAVRESQIDLHAAFKRVSPIVSEDLSEENTFIFALSYWSRKVIDFAEHLVDSNQTTLAIYWGAFKAMRKALEETWAPGRIFRSNHLKFCFRNLCSIMVCFFIGYFSDAGFFTRYDSTMAVTLTLLHVSDGSHHVEYEKCMHRLLGVALGKSLPIIINGFSNIFACGSMQRNIFQGLSTWIFVFSGCFLYYDSAMWSYVGCLVGGFGIPGLVGPCMGNASDAVIVAKYKEIGSFIVAIIIQALLHTAMSRRSARLLLGEKMHHLGGAVKAGYEGIFEQDIPKVEEAVKLANKHLDRVKALAPECDTRVQLFRGRSTDFKDELCQCLITSWEYLVRELRMLEVAVKDWEALTQQEDGVNEEVTFGMLQMLNDRPSMEDVREDILSSVELVTQIAPEMLSGNSAHLAHARLLRLGTVQASSRLKAASRLYEELAWSTKSIRGEKEELTDDVRVRATIAVRGLEHAAYHLSKMEERCIKEATSVAATMSFGQ